MASPLTGVQLEVEGAEHLQGNDGPAIILGNHQRSVPYPLEAQFPASRVEESLPYGWKDGRTEGGTVRARTPLTEPN